VGGGCALLFGSQTAVRARSGLGCWLMPFAESGAPGLVEPDGRVLAISGLGSLAGRGQGHCGPIEK